MMALHKTLRNTAFLFIVLAAFVLLASPVLAQPALPPGAISAEIQSVKDALSGIFFVFILVFTIFAAALFALGQIFGAEARARVTVYANNVLVGIIASVLLYAIAPYVVDLLATSVTIGAGSAGAIYAIWIAVISVILAAMALVIARVLDHRQLEQAAKSELVFAASTVLIAVALIVFIAGFEKVLVGVANSMIVRTYAPSFAQDPNLKIGGPGATLADMAKFYLAAPQECMRTAMKVLEYLAIPVETMASFFLEIFMSEHASGFFFKFLSERISNLAKILTFYQWASYLIFHLFNFIKYYGMLFLSAGIALRAFPPTRGAGAYLIALSIGLYLIFPLSYILLSNLLSNFTFTKDNFSAMPQAGGVGYACKLPAIPGIEDIQYCGASSPEFATEMLETFKAHQSDMISFLDYLSGNLLKSISLAVCFLPLVSLTITLTFVLSTTSLFGGQIPEIGRGLIKLI